MTESLTLLVTPYEKTMATPGWNDPPNVAYSSNNVITSKKTALNKRVPFPQNGSLLLSGNEKGEGGVQLVPPADLSVTSSPLTPAPLVIPPPPSSSSQSKGKESNEATTGQEETKPSNDDDVTPNLSSPIELHDETIHTLKHCFGLCSQTLQKRTIEDIDKRLGVLSNMWITGKLNEDVQLRMNQLTKALQNENYDEANSIHLALIVDHVSQVSPWMVAIKHLIHEARNQKVSIATEDKKENENEN